MVEVHLLYERGPGSRTCQDRRLQSGKNGGGWGSREARWIDVHSVSGDSGSTQAQLHRPPEDALELAKILRALAAQGAGRRRGGRIFNAGRLSARLSAKHAAEEPAIRGGPRLLGHPRRYSELAGGRRRSQGTRPPDPGHGRANLMGNLMTSGTVKEDIAKHTAGSPRKADRGCHRRPEHAHGLTGPGKVPRGALEVPRASKNELSPFSTDESLPILPVEARRPTAYVSALLPRRHS